MPPLPLAGEGWGEGVRPRERDGCGRYFFAAPSPFRYFAMNRSTWL
jgi:hypothetical protein